MKPNAVKYCLKPSRRPKKHRLLSGVIHVCDDKGRRPAYISFSEAFVRAVGNALPYGLSKDFPAFLKVKHNPVTDVWQVYAMYLKDESGLLLWEQKQIPDWVSA